MSNFLIDIFNVCLQLLNIIPSPSVVTKDLISNVKYCNIPGCKANSQVACNNNEVRGQETFKRNS